MESKPESNVSSTPQSNGGVRLHDFVSKTVSLQAGRTLKYLLSLNVCDSKLLIRNYQPLHPKSVFPVPVICVVIQLKLSYYKALISFCLYALNH